MVFDFKKEYKEFYIVRRCRRFGMSKINDKSLVKQQYKRLVDVAIRRGFNDLTIPKWKAFLELKSYFDEKAGVDIYKLLNV